MYFYIAFMFPFFLDVLFDLLFVGMISYKLEIIITLSKRATSPFEI